MCVSVHVSHPPENIILNLIIMQIEQDIGLMFSQDGETDLKEVFISTWGRYVTAILTFTEEKTWSWRKALRPAGNTTVICRGFNVGKGQLGGGGGGYPLDSLRTIPYYTLQ